MCLKRKREKSVISQKLLYFFVSKKELYYFLSYICMNIQPLFDRVVLKAVQEESISSSGIILPESENKERPFMYEVIAVWPGKPDRDMSGISVWDKVLAGQYSWDEVKIDGEEYKIVAVEYILAKVS